MSEIKASSLADSGWFDSSEGSFTPKEVGNGLDLVWEEVGLEFTSGNSAVRRVASKFVHVLFDYALLHRANGTNQLNLYGEPVVVKEHLTIAGSGESLRGALAQGKYVGGLVSSDSFLDVVPLLRAGQGAMVIHASSERYGSNGIESDYSAIQSGLDSDLRCLVSYSVQESYDIAVACHLLAIATKRPVLHVYDGIAVGNVSSGVKFHEFDKLIPQVDGLDLEGVFKLMSECGGFPNYSTVEASEIGNVISALPNIGGIRLRQLRPFPGQAFLEALDGSDVVVVEPIATGRGLIYGEILKWTYLLDQRITRQLPQLNEPCLDVWGTSGVVGKTLAAILSVQYHIQVDTTSPVFKEQLPFPVNITAIQDFSILKYLHIPLGKQISLINVPEKEAISELPPGGQEVYCIDAESVAKEWGSDNEVGLVFLMALSFCHAELSIRIKLVLSKTLSEASFEVLFSLVKANLKLINISSLGDVKLPFRGHSLDFPKPVGNAIPSADSIVKWQRIFKYSTHSSPRPDIEDCHLINVTRNIRLTPTSYDRNVFHLEFNTHNLSYNVGDALGVFGINNPEKVNKLLRALDIHPESTLLLPDYSQSNSFIVTAKQLFSQFLDLFGRPNKGFYSFLAGHAQDRSQADDLLFLASPEGSTQFQARADDTITYADLLLEFDSARPKLQLLADAIPRIQPRHYSIASAMSLHPSSVHLLLVHVNWKNSRGYQSGQCTDYLSRLVPGDTVLVHVKPSLMTLPEDPRVPIVMAGLGTGMAPFRAFIQERHAQKVQGLSVGPSVLYFGSRHRTSEYLYGDELDEYHSTNTLTSLRLAFSRDQPNKVYIQTLMQQDLELLQINLLDRNGSFYLCGPTWPERSVRNALIQALSFNNRMSPDDAQSYLRQMKDEGRYILELY